MMVKSYYIMLKLSFYFAKISSFSLIFLSFLVAYDAFMRYLFSEGTIALQELEWHLFDIIFLFGFAYTLKMKKHVRVDILYVNYSKEKKALINIFSMILLLIPFSTIFIIDSYDMVYQSFYQNEVSPNPGGLKERWIIKSTLLFSFILLFIQAILEILISFKEVNKKEFFILSFAIFIAGVTIYTLWFYRTPFYIEPLILIFILTLTLLLMGFEVAFVFMGVSLLFALISDEVGLHTLEMLPHRTYGIMENITLMAVPLFIFMGIILEKSKIAQTLLLSMGKLFGRVRGGIAISVVVVGAMLAASTGIVGASVVMMTLIALPLMIKHNYNPAFASGTIASSGTLGQLIPPSIVLIILGDQMHISVGDLFKVAIIPGFLLVVFYILYILIVAFFKKDYAPAIKVDEPYSKILKEAILSSIPPLMLIVIVLGSILMGLASPYESASIGVLGSLFLAFIKKELSFEMLKEASIETVILTSMIFMILIGATAFSLVFNALDGQDLALNFFTQEQDKWSFIIISMVVIFLLGFFIDFIEIAFVIVPILVPIVASLGIDPLWFAMLIALNLQASFLTPPFGFTLFYLKGAIGDKVKTKDIYIGVIPFIIIQVILLVLIMLYPKIIYINF